MGTGDVIEQVRMIAARVAASYGLDIFAVQYRREGSGMVLRVQIDRPGAGATEADSVGIEDCARISRDLSAILDVEDILPVAYTLEVSSPGLDRPLRHADDYARFAGRRAKLVMREAVDGQMFFKGRLGGVDGSRGETSERADQDAGDARAATGTPAAIGAPAVIIVTDDGRSHRVPVSVITRGNLEVEF